jgi:lipopolysaccharide transport system permease protein
METPPTVCDRAHTVVCLAVVLSEMIHFLIAIPVFGVLLLLSDIKSPGLAWLAGIPVLLTVQASLTFAAVTVIATLNAFLRDLEQLVRVFLLLLFYITPVLYPVSIVPKNLDGSC